MRKQPNGTPGEKTPAPSAKLGRKPRRPRTDGAPPAPAASCDHEESSEAMTLALRTVHRCRIIQRKSGRSGAIGEPVSVVRNIL